MVDTVQGAIFGWGNTRTGYMPESDHQIRHDRTIHTPEWMIRMDGILSSTVKDYEQYAELQGVFFEASRSTLGRISNQLFTSGAMQHSDIVVKVPTGAYIADLKVKMNDGSTIQEVSIVQLGHKGDQRVKFLEIVHKNCKIQSYQMQMTAVLITYRFEEETLTGTQHNQAGEEQGKRQSVTNYTTDTASPGES